MKYLAFLLFSFCLLPCSFYAQALDLSKGEDLLEEIPQEKIFVHYNSSLLFSGEYMYYKLYNLHAETGDLSKTSKVAYIELVSEGENTIFKHKILLKNGVGQGDFFIPTNLPSGNYKLLGYTNWMRNSGSFFAGDVAIINPYLGDQSAISADSEEDPLLFKNNSEVKSLEENLAAPVKIIVENDLFGKREKVDVKLEGAPGTYSLSVRKKDSINIPQKFTSEDFTQLFQKQSQSSSRDSVFVPEMRGNLISGRIVPTNSNAKIKLAGKKLAFSLPGEDFVFKVATTNNEGEFYINLDDRHDTSEALMQILGEDSENWNIQLDPLPKIKDPDLEFGKFRITPEMEEWILDRSVQNQIENAYYSVKPDTLKALEKKEAFYVKQPTVYDLDAYTRFETIKETFVEIIRYAWVATNKGESRIVVRQPQGATNYNLPTLLLVDGAMVQDHDLFINYPAKYVKSINILRDNIFLGSHIFAGIVDVKTIEGNFDEILNQDHIKKVDLKLPEPTKYYFKQTYENQSANQLSRIPDLRTQLFWKPSVELVLPTEELDFYTSDVPGTFEIHLEGFTSTGKPVSVKKEIKVNAVEVR
jgi:hypothetical protein